MCSSTQLSYFKGDPRKPVVLLYPSLMVVRKGKKVKVSAEEGFVIRLLPCCARDVMAPARLAPGRNNVRTRYAIMLADVFFCLLNVVCASVGL